MTEQLVPGAGDPGAAVPEPRTAEPPPPPLPPLGTPRRRQRPALGCLLRLVGGVLTFAGAVLFIVAANRVKTVLVPTPGTVPMWQNVLVVLSVGVGAGATLLVGRRMRVRGRRHHARVVRTMEEATTGPYVLYLRPFTEDVTGTTMPHAFSRWRGVGGSLADGSSVTLEESVCRIFRMFGSPLAVGEPDEALPLAGARRLYLPFEDWQRTVTALIGDARLVLLVAGTSEGTLWELTEVVRLRGPGSVLILLYGDEEPYDAFRTVAERALAERADELRQVHGPDWQPPVFPPFPGLQDPERLRWVPLMRAVIHFEEDWTPRLTLLDPTAVHAWTQEGRARKMGRTQLTPLLTRVYDRLAQEAADAGDATGATDSAAAGRGGEARDGGAGGGGAAGSGAGGSGGTPTLPLDSRR
ncbi:hypothetical protein ACIQAC_36280 [Streptomyces sp. NPDC088387]|uniref:hypothetical protein n=1 Tax=Streptomyces sp. NPDC088387 TaxID=3365859 RepID=UPI0038239653